MSRTDKLYKRLDELEAEYIKLAENEFNKVLSNQSSTYFSRKIPYLFDGKFYLNAETAHLEKIESEILALREKLGSPVKSSPVSIVFDYSSKLEGLKDKLTGGKKSLTKEYQKKLSEFKNSP